MEGQMIELFFGLASVVLATAFLRWLHLEFPRASTAVWRLLGAKGAAPQWHPVDFDPFADDEPQAPGAIGTGGGREPRR
jgi:hypothetical protein